ncbi:hypothetical protein HM1_2478 [Heliomicrobium modesticaldum Ice1]|uniref:Uncharacterized protein n=1 Tax=Heliobacterium modesticaldum (strain ATCC 51547 / Ice1) TaxID=498761 RepID=B0TAH8_HELMI|nr:hypothetical protein HM1_2478 [Heliomicrobium modesticaldum Ice1]
MIRYANKTDGSFGLTAVFCVSGNEFCGGKTRWGYGFSLSVPRQKKKRLGRLGKMTGLFRS